MRNRQRRRARGWAPTRFPETRMQRRRPCSAERAGTWMLWFVRTRGRAPCRRSRPMRYEPSPRRCFPPGHGGTATLVPSASRIATPSLSWQSPTRKGPSRWLRQSPKGRSPTLACPPASAETQTRARHFQSRAGRWTTHRSCRPALRRSRWVPTHPPAALRFRPHSPGGAPSEHPRCRRRQPTLHRGWPSSCCARGATPLHRTERRRLAPSQRRWSSLALGQSRPHRQRGPERRWHRRPGGRLLMVGCLVEIPWLAPQGTPCASKVRTGKPLDTLSENREQGDSTRTLRPVGRLVEADRHCRYRIGRTPATQSLTR
jgi:hypothetical protein